VNNILEGMWKELDMACFNLLSKCLTGMAKTMKLHSV
jgi:hypothetical protein